MFCGANGFFGRFFGIGGYDKEEKAARAYDLAALKYWGTSTTTNFPVSHKMMRDAQIVIGEFLSFFLWDNLIIVKYVAD